MSIPTNKEMIKAMFFVAIVVIYKIIKYINRETIKR